MGQNEFLELTVVCEKLLNQNNERVNNNEEIVSIISFAHKLKDTHRDLISKFETTNVMFQHYYDSESSPENLINMFNYSYLAKDSELQTDLFAIYIFVKKIKEFIEGIEIFSDDPEDFNDYLKTSLPDMQYLIETLNSQVMDDPTTFLTEGKYKTMFDGLSEIDLSNLESSITKALKNKVINQLSTMDAVPGAEVIRHVKESYGLPVFRLHLAKDYRVAFVRNGNVTCILGLDVKSGKEIDYNRYDAVAANKDALYQRMEDFDKGIESESHIACKQILAEKIKRFKL